MVHRVLLGSLALACLTACTTVDWGRALYEGQRASAQQCKLQPPNGGPPCAELPEHAEYERERARHRRDPAAVREAASAAPPP